MAVIGSWGDIVFSVSREEVKTFDGLKWNTGAKYAEHKRHLKEPLLEFTGIESEKMSFSMLLSTNLGVDPIKEIAKLLKAMRAGEAHRLVIGTKAYGTNKWVITKVNNALNKYDNKGNLLQAKVTVNMTSYSAR